MASDAGWHAKAVDSHPLRRTLNSEVQLFSSMVFTHPLQEELTQFFGVEPAESVPEDGYWAYEARDTDGICARFSFNAHERSVQIVLSCW